jgi:hypothetical protein
MPTSTGTNKTSAEQLDLETARRRCAEVIRRAYETKTNTLVNALPAMGKTHSAVKEAATTGTKVTILTTRGREEQYEKISELCEEFGLDYEVLPSAYEECPILNGNMGEDKKDEVEDLIERFNITPRELHSIWDSLECQQNGGCPCESGWEKNSDEYDVLIGHYLHAYIGEVVNGRTIVFDEFPGDTYVQEVDNLQKNVGRFVDQKISSAVSNGYLNSYNDVIIHRNEGSLREIRYFSGCGSDELRDLSSIQGNGKPYHPYSPLATMGLYPLKDLGNGWKSAELGYGQVALKHEEDDKMHLLIPPDLEKAENVVALDGTPSALLWEKVLHTKFEQVQVLDDEERKRYVREVQGIEIVTVSKSLHPYFSGRYVKTEKDAALIKEIEEKHGQKPGVITSKVALEKLEDTDANFSDTSTYYGNVRGSNDLGDEDVVVILGSPEPGSKRVKKEAAIWGEDAEMKGRGLDKEYGFIGDKVHRRRCQSEVLQSVFRSGREGSGATVYVKTGALPDWVPMEEADGVKSRPESEKEVIEKLAQNGESTASEIAHMVDYAENTVREKLRYLHKEGVVEKKGRNRGTSWKPDGLSDVNKKFEVDVDPEKSDPHNIYNNTTSEEINWIPAGTTKVVERDLKRERMRKYLRIGRRSMESLREAVK